MEKSFLNSIIHFVLTKRLIAVCITLLIVLGGLITSPFNISPDWLPKYPVSVDAIPDIGENQQIVFTEWPGRSPQDIEDQISYPLTVSLMGMPGVKTIRSYSYFGFSSIYIIFEENIEFYWSRSRILEKLNSLPKNLLPQDAQPTLGPDATALGQVYWYTLEGLSEDKKPLGGWDLDELRSIHDFYVRYALQSVPGVAEVASAGGMVREYQVDVDPDKLRHLDITLEQVYNAVRQSNQEVGARTVEINRVEYVLRGRGYLEDINDLRSSVIVQREHRPITLDQVAHVHLGPAPRRGGLDKDGAETVGGVVVVRYGENPMKVIKAVEEKVKDISSGLPKRTLADGSVSQITIVPFYNRAGLIHETLDTLKTALTEEILITIIVILFMLGNIRSSLMISFILPLSVLSCFIFMKLFNIDANIVALSGIAIAIGTMVDMGIIISENIVRGLQSAAPDEHKLKVIYRSTIEVSSACFTAVMTTIVSFIPVFTMTAAEGKLFKPLAYTKTFALISALIFSLFILPPIASFIFSKKAGTDKIMDRYRSWMKWIMIVLTLFYLAFYWAPLGPQNMLWANILFVSTLVLLLMFGFKYFIQIYPSILGWCLQHKLPFLLLPLLILAGGIHTWKNTGSEFMPALDEGSFLLMPTTMPHASYEEAQEQLSLIDQILTTIPEVETAVGKLGRAESSLDPAPVSMYEVVINYKNEYGMDSNGQRIRQWRDHIQSPDDIWKEIVEHVKIPGMTSAPKLQPIAARIVMLQSGMRASMGIRIKGPDLKTIESFGMEIERELKTLSGIEAATVVADRIVGKPYLEYKIDRNKAARYGLSISHIQNILMTALGGRTATYTVEGRERYAVRVRYMREERDNLKSLSNLLIDTPDGAHIPITQVADVEFTRGPMVIKGEDGFLIGYVTFDKSGTQAEAELVEEASAYIAGLIEDKVIKQPKGISYEFTGNYQNHLRAQQTLFLVLPIVFIIILIILYLQFSSISTTLFIFSGIFIAWSGGFLLIALYNTDWFLNVEFFNTNLRDLFQIRQINLSVAVWVGFIALFGIASDDGVVISEYLRQSFARTKPKSVNEIRRLVMEAGKRRVRPCVMTSATTILALLPVLTSTGKGSDIMIPMSIPIFGGMIIVLVSIFVVPTLYCLSQELKWSRDPSN